MENLLKGNYSFRLPIDEKLENQEVISKLFESFDKIANQEFDMRTNGKWKTMFKK